MGRDLYGSYAIRRIIRGLIMTKKQIINILFILLLMIPSVALAKGGHGGHGGHGSHGAHSHKSGSKSGAKSSSKGSSSKGFHFGRSSSKSVTRASSVGTPVTSWKSLPHKSITTNSFAADTQSISPLYQGTSPINMLMYRPLYIPHVHSVPQTQTEDETDDTSNILIVIVVIGIVLLGLFSLGLSVY